MKNYDVSDLYLITLKKNKKIIKIQIIYS